MRSRSTALEVLLRRRSSSPVGGDFYVVRQVVFGHGEEFVVEVNDAGVCHAGAVVVVNDPEQPSSIKEEQSGDAGVAVEFTNGFGEAFHTANFTPHAGAVVVVESSRRDMDAEISNIKKWIILYPVYINSKKTIAEGRRISTGKACENPTCIGIGDCCAHFKRPFAIELDKAYPRDFMQRGRAKVLLKKEDGTLVNPAISSMSRTFNHTWIRTCFDGRVHIKVADRRWSPEKVADQRWLPAGGGLCNGGGRGWLCLMKGKRVIFI